MDSKMNERIKELWDEAAKLEPDPSWQGQTRFMEKFAELIVKECLKEIKDMIVDESELLYPNNKQTTEFVNDRLLDAYDNIKEHFGVEE
jgi:hypothetical protein